METIYLSLFLMLCLGVHRSSSEILKRQKRNWIIDSFSIDEDYDGPFPYILGTVKVERNLTFYKIRGQGVDIEPKGILKIDENTGVITVLGPVDYETYNVLKLTFQAFKDQHVVDTQLGIEILINDANDNPPKFDPEKYEVSIKESTPQGTSVVTVKASDEDSNENNRLFVFKIVSVTPQSPEQQFYLTQAGETASISFKGCLDHEKVDKYTIIVEAKDRGEKIQLSSSCTVIINVEDGNNHLPVITGQTGPGRVKEGQENVLVKRLQVADQDSKGTPAWRAKFQIFGDTNNNFRITTDPETNEGLLYVEKLLDYENTPLIKVNISVENEIPYHLCKVVSPSTAGLWNVITSDGATGTQGPSTSQVTVVVEDINDPPIFDLPNKKVWVSENVKVGHYLATFTARDRDAASAATLVYRKGEDPAFWVTVDPKTGNVTTSKIIDRESTFVRDNVYKVTIFASDNGFPPMTGTATLDIHIIDQNDNAPSLLESTLEMCQSDGQSLANITALDADEEPYGGPFKFTLLGDVKGKWKVDPTLGDSVNLVKEHTVHSGEYELSLEVVDLQGVGAVHNLSVTVCNCVDMERPNCRMRKSTGSALGSGALLILFISMLLLAGVLLVTFLLSCKREKKQLPDDLDSGQLMKFNTERPGTDCDMAFEAIIDDEQIGGQIITEPYPISVGLSPAWRASNGQSKLTITQKEYLRRMVSQSSMGQSSFSRRSSMRWSMDPSALRRKRNSKREIWVGHRRGSLDLENGLMRHNEMMIKALTMMLQKLEAPREELGDYDPHVYAEEGDIETDLELDAISMADIPFDPDLDLDFKFNYLASICMPSESTAYSTKPRPQRLVTPTRFQVDSLK